ncbi:MAG: DUF2190 family protein [Planctomycetaceae bacterium]|jgi:predicted RecA/RadA family phage recombinase|nr:DUF2190 family protein [Planctomycetaceae bacterium]
MPYVREDAYFEFPVTQQAGVEPDKIVTSGNLVGITKFAYKQNETGLAYLDGEYLVPIAALAGPVTQGTALYVTSAGAFTTTASTNTKVGSVSRAAATSDTSIYFFINR